MGRSKRITLHNGKHFIIRGTLNGGKYILARPNGAALDDFTDFNFAVAVAEYCDARGGAYDGETRKAAKLVAIKEVAS